MSENDSKLIRSTLRDIHDQIKELRQEGRGTRAEIRELKSDIHNNYLGREKYDADQEINKIVKNLVFGLVALILVGFVTAVIALVIK